MLASRNLSLTLLRCRPVTPRHRLLPVPVTVLVGALLAVSLPGSGGADSAPALLQRAHDLRAANTTLAARTHAALLRLYSLDAQLARARARLDALAAQAEAVRRERVLTAKRLRIARHDVAAADAMTVVATAYSGTGATATGLAAGWGVVAVDPSVIPLGTRMSIPGYGDGVAADTGGAIRGNTIDLWFPTLAQANAWGRRTVTITLH